jgi:hypothetical protein
MQIGVISPQDWGLPVAEAISEAPIPVLGAAPAELIERLRANTFEWLPGQYSKELGAFHGFYSAPRQALDVPQTANLIGPWQLIAAYDRFGDQDLLARARRAGEWFHEHFVVTHPMHVGIGGVRDTFRPQELWVKYSAEFVILNCGLHRRTGSQEYIRRARQSAAFLIQSARYGFRPKYNDQREVWEEKGWQSFGRVIEAYLELERTTGEEIWRQRALQWAEFGLTLQAADGCFYLINDDYFNSDLAADELRAFTFLYELTGREEFLQAALRFAGCLLTWQRDDGAWPLTIDREGNVVVPTVGPGDVPNIAIALLRLYSVTGEDKYRKAALLAVRYSLGVQALPQSAHPYLDDPRVRYGYWSWDPYYDFTLSADQSTHHVRGMMFLLDMPNVY